MANPEFHLDEAIAVGLVTNRLSGVDRNRAVRHLLSGCVNCRSMVTKVLRLNEWAPAGVLEPLAGSGMTVTAAEVAGELVEGGLRWLDVERLPWNQRLAFVKKSRDHRTYGVFHAGLIASRKLAQSRPDDAINLAQFLLSLAELIEPRFRITPELRFDWRAEAAMVLAQAKRSAGDFAGATAALDMAEAFLALGTLDEVDRAMFYVQRGGLEADLGDFEKSVTTLESAAALFRFAEDHNSVGKVLLHQAVIIRHLDPKRAFELAEDGLTKIDKTEVRAELSAHWTMAYCQAEMGETDEAESIVSTYRYLIEKQTEYVRVIFDLLISRIRYRQNRRAEAEQILREVQNWYLVCGFRFEAVLTTIDLIDLLVDDDRMGEALYLANEVLPVLRAWGLHRDTLAVMNLIREKLDSAAVSEGMLRTLADQIRRTWHKNGRAGLPTY